MHSRLKLIVPLGMLFFGCIDVPEVEPLPAPSTQPDTGQPPDTNVPQADFALTASPTRVSLFQGQRQSVLLTLTRSGGFTGGVTVSALNAPAGVTVLPVTIPAGAATGTLEVSASESATPGTLVLTLRATAGALTREAAVEMSVVKLGDLLARWSNPTADQVHVNGALALQVAVEGGTADYVELLKGETVLARLSASPYQYTWDTTQEAEQTYTLTARAVRGSTSFTTPARTVVVDRTPPTVASRAPSHGATNVSVRETVTVSFSERLRPTTVKDSGVLVTAGSTNVAKALALSSNGLTLTVSPTSPLPVQSTVNVTLGTATEPLMDLAGNALAAMSWTFSVPTWLPVGGALSAAGGSTPAENVTMRMDKSGNPIIAWAEFDGSSKNIHVQRWTGAQWENMGGALSALSGTGTNADRPSLALDGAGNPVIVWDESNGNNINLHGMRWTGSSWIALPAFPALSTNALNGHQRYLTALAIDGSGNLAVSADDVMDTAHMAVFLLRTGQPSWTNIYSHPSGAAYPSSSHLSFDTSGALFVSLDAFWTPAESRAVLVQKYLSTGGVELVGGQAQAGGGKSALVLDGSGKPNVAYVSEGCESCAVYTSGWTGSDWQSYGSSVSTTQTQNSAPSIIIDGTGQPLVAWSGFASPERSIWVSRWDGAAWQPVGPPLSALSGSSTASFKPVLALDKAGQPLVAWHESDGTTSHVFVHRYNH